MEGVDVMSWKPKEEFESEFGKFKNGIDVWHGERIPWDDYRVIELTETQRCQLKAMVMTLEDILNPDGNNLYGRKMLLTMKIVDDWDDEYYSLIENDIVHSIMEILDAKKIEVGSHEGGCA